MKEIIPLKKDIIFKTKIGEITNISLEHDYKILDDLVEGEVNINGTYKMTEASVIDEEFEYKVLFGIAISKKVDKDTIKIDIDDFKYDINKDVLKVNIDLLLTCDELEKKTEDIKNEIEEEPDELDDYLNNYFKDDMELPKEVEKTVEPVINDIDIENNISNITNTIINNENKYYTYKIYILREGDTVDTICNKYNITKEELSMYNTLSDLKIGDKIIIPEVNE